MLLLFPACSGDSERSVASEPVTFATGRSPSADPMSIAFQDRSTVIVEVVSSPETRSQGLMFRPSLNADRGMLFVFPVVARHSFWMKNTLIPLDIVWLDLDGVVVHVEEDVEPCQADPCPSYEPGADASYVLELAAGQAAVRNVQIGDHLVFRGGIENIVPR